MLQTLTEHVALLVEHGECPGCQKFTQTFSLAKTHDDAWVIRAEAWRERQHAPDDDQERAGVNGVD